MRKNSFTTAKSQLKRNNYLHASFEVKMKKIGHRKYWKITIGKENKMMLTENASTLFFLNIETPPSAVDSLKWLERLKYHHLLISETRFVLWMLCGLQEESSQRL